LTKLLSSLNAINWIVVQLKYQKSKVTQSIVCVRVFVSSDHVTQSERR